MTPHAFALVYRRGPAWVEGASILQQPLSEHLAYMKGLRGRGLLMLAGPFADDSGGLAVLDLRTPAEAQAIADDDPAVRSGVMCVDVRPWHLLAGPQPAVQA